VDRGDDRRTAAYRLLFCWMAVWLVAFTVAATKLPNYVLPMLVPLAIVIARFLDRWQLGTLRVPRWVPWVSLSCLALIGVGLSAGLLTASGLRGRSLDCLANWAWLGAIPVVGCVAGHWCLRSGHRAGVLASVAVAAVGLFVPLWGWAVAAVNVAKSPEPLVAQSGAADREADIRVVAWGVDHLPSLNFYVQRHVEYCVTEAEVRTFLEYPLPVYLFLPATQWESLRTRLNVPCREVARHADLYRRDATVVVTNR
jgi:hypothetical protein